MSGMKYTKMKGIDKPVAKIAMGSMIYTLRDDVTGCEWMEKTKADSFQLLEEAYELGYTAIDTAAIYANGESELCIGEWMKENNLRDKLFLIGKGGAICRHLRPYSPEAIIRDVLTSLDKMQTDYIDVYLTHHDNPEVPVEEIVDAFAYLQGKGYIHGYGGSNWSDVNRTKRAVAYAKEKGYPPFIVSEPGFSLAEPVYPSWGAKEENLNHPSKKDNYEFYKETGMTLFTWSSMARGFWSGTFDRESFPQYKDTWDKTCVRSFCHEVNFKRMDRVKEYGARIDASVPNIALAWLLNQPLDIHPIIGAGNKSELLDNLEALSIPMDDKTIAWLNLKSDERPW
jgi:aryl-alcohol dehydrogenase-like predicted oxidoreductase